jgi:hypothetical protein
MLFVCLEIEYVSSFFIIVVASCMVLISPIFNDSGSCLLLITDANSPL